MTVTIPHQQAHPHFWLGTLAAALGEASKMEGKTAQKYCKTRVAEFIASPVPSEELRQTLRGYLK